MTERDDEKMGEGQRARTIPLVYLVQTTSEGADDSFHNRKLVFPNRTVETNTIVKFLPSVLHQS